MLITAADTAGTKFTKNDSTLSQKNQFSEIYVTRNKAEKLDISFSSTFRVIYLGNLAATCPAVSRTPRVHAAQKCHI